MRKLTKVHFNNIVNVLREDIAAYVAKTKQVFTKDSVVNELQYDDIVYVNNKLVNFMLDKDVQKLYNALIAQDTYVREQFLSVMYYCEEHNIYLY